MRRRLKKGRHFSWLEWSQWERSDREQAEQAEPANGKLEQLQTQGVLVPGPRPNTRSQFSRVLFSASPVTCQVPQSEKVEQALQM